MIAFLNQDSSKEPWNVEKDLSDYFLNSPRDDT